MGKYFFKPFQTLIVVILLLFSGHVIAVRCPNCGFIPVPYPLSTAPNCGDQSYKIRCTGGKLWFDALHGSFYPIVSINPVAQRIIIRTVAFTDPTCVSTEILKQGFQLDQRLQFRISTANTILLLNCGAGILKAPIDCKPTSLCHSYIKDNAPACNKAPLCCAFKMGETMTKAPALPPSKTGPAMTHLPKKIGPAQTQYQPNKTEPAQTPYLPNKIGPAQTPYEIKVDHAGCLAYQSFVGLGVNGVPKGRKWPEPALELEWSLPKEPMCVNIVDCKMGLPKSNCLPDPANRKLRRCYCKAGLEWDPVNGVCMKCRGRRCKKKKKIGLFAGVAVAMVGVLAAAVTVGVLMYNKQRPHQVKKELHKTKIKEREEKLNTKSLGKSTAIFTGKEITRATNNFSKENLIGTGGFGEVFKGILDDGTITAIKRAKLTNCNTGSDQLLNEVKILCQVNHRSLVRLLGCCVDLEEAIMIYEFIPNGTLFEHLHCSSNSEGKRPPLSWRRRLRVAHQTAEGLAYLHSAAVPPIYHRDVKSSNILLDEKHNAKVADFGLSRLVDLTETNNESHIFTSAQGTLGYLDPEYYRNFQLTDKSDVYSFGVVLLEILTSKKAIDFNRDEEHVNLVVYAKKIIGEERLMEVVDPMLKKGATKIELETIKAMGNLAASCLDDRRQNRPSMKEVADEIEYVMSIAAGEVREA